METNRRGFFATAASSLAWLMGVKALPRAWMVACEYDPDIKKEVCVGMTDGNEKYWLERRTLTANEWRMWRK